MASDSSDEEYCKSYSDKDVLSALVNPALVSPPQRNKAQPRAQQEQPREQRPRRTIKPTKKFQELGQSVATCVNLASKFNCDTIFVIVKVNHQLNGVAMVTIYIGMDQQLFRV